MAEICHLISHNGDLDKIDRNQEPMPVEFVYTIPTKEILKSGKPLKASRLKRAEGWKSPRALVTHVPKSFLPDEILTKKKGKVTTLAQR